MSLPGNGIFVVQGEMAILVTAMRRGSRWGSHSSQDEEHDVLMRAFQDLRDILNQVADLRLLDPNVFLGPFLEVIRSEKTTGPVTCFALSAINKFLCYGLIDPMHISVPATVENIADAVTHARFVGTDHSSDGVVLMKILQVLRTLVLSPEGAMLTDESVCEIMLSCFRICFETRLSELLRRNAEQCLRDMTQLVFMRLPQFSSMGGNETEGGGEGALSLRRRPTAARRDRILANSMTSPKTDIGTSKSPALSPMVKTSNSGTRLNTISVTVSASNKVLDMQGSISQPPKSEIESSALDQSCRSISELGKTEEQQTVDSNLEMNVENSSPSTLAKSPSKKHGRHSSMDLASSDNIFITQLVEKCVNSSENSVSEAFPDSEAKSKLPNSEIFVEGDNREMDYAVNTSKNESEATTENNGSLATDQNAFEKSGDSTLEDKENTELEKDYVNPRGVRFISQDEQMNLQPYGLVCVRELFRFLISLCNPMDSQNSSSMVHLGLCLVETALEVGADHLAKYPSLLQLVKDPLCRNLLSLLDSERVSIFALDLQVSFLLFESLRTHLKFQMESFFTKLVETIMSDNAKNSYELKEITHLSLESITQMWRIPGLCTELYLNYDCDIYCSNLFEDITKLLSKTIVAAGVHNYHMLALDALFTIIDSIEANCHQSKLSSMKSSIDLDHAPIADSSCQNIPVKGQVSIDIFDSTEGGDDSVVHDISQYITCAKLGRHKPNINLPTKEQLSDIKNRKRWIATGTEHFNQKPEKGIEYLQEHGILATPLAPLEVAHFLRVNPGLDKKMIGEYISKKKNVESRILATYAASFDMMGLRVDQALRLYLETFRLPGEAPLIFLVMEHFAEHWHACNGNPFANTDAAFRLAYAIIMLNMDQHNHNAKKLNIPMTVEDFVRNLRGCNGSNDFDQKMLEAVFNSIKNEEIVMPAERTGIVKENYLWKVLLRRGATKEGLYVHSPSGAFDRELFMMTWGPTVAALSSIFEKSSEVPLYSRALEGFDKCASIVGQYALTNELDTLVFSLCKFTGLLSIPEHTQYVAIGVALAQAPKSRLALKKVFSVCHRHANSLREGWKHILEVVLALFKGHLLPKVLTEADDFCSPSGKVSLLCEPLLQPKAQEAGLLSSLYSYIALSSDTTSTQRQPTADEAEVIQGALDCVMQCNITGMLLTDSKFLQLDSLQELVKYLIAAGKVQEGTRPSGIANTEDPTIFFLELLIKVVIQNRDRVSHVWQVTESHVTSLMKSSSVTAQPVFVDKSAGGQMDRPLSGPARPNSGLLERSSTGLLRLAICLMRSEECASDVLRSLKALLDLTYPVYHSIASRIAIGLFELVKTSAQNIHSADDWAIVFTLLETTGAGAMHLKEDENTLGSKSDGAVSSEDDSVSTDRGYTSDSELSNSPQTQGWILVGSNTGSTKASSGGVLLTGSPETSLVHACALRPHDPPALLKCWECLAFIVRDVAHITPYNFEACVNCIRTFVEASLHGKNEEKVTTPMHSSLNKDSKRKKQVSHLRRVQRQQMSNDRLADGLGDKERNVPDGYQLISIQLLDLMHTLHSRTAQIFKWWREESNLSSPIPIGNKTGSTALEWCDLWHLAWQPLLQGIARLCTDNRKQVSNSAVTYLQRALLVHDLQTLSGEEWEACFHYVLFPLLARLTCHHDEVRLRANTIMCKVFLHHLTPLLSRPSFPNLWLSLLDLMRSMMTGPHTTDLLYEATLESLKNMLLVMDSVKVFSDGDVYSELWNLTWSRINDFIPNLKDDLFKPIENSKYQNPKIPNIQEKDPLSIAPPLESPHPPVSGSYLLSSQPSHRSPPAPNMVDLQRSQVGSSHIPLTNIQPVQQPGYSGPSSGGLPSPTSTKPLQVPTTSASRGSSIILQPPMMGSQVHSSLFTHLGQMVSTPIGVAVAVSAQNKVSSYPILCPNPMPQKYYSHQTPLQTPSQNAQYPSVQCMNNQEIQILPNPASQFTLISPQKSQQLDTHHNSTDGLKDSSNFELTKTNSDINKIVESNINQDINIQNAIKMEMQQPMSIYGEYLTNPYNPLLDVSVPENKNNSNTKSDILENKLHSKASNNASNTVPPINNADSNLDKNFNYDESTTAMPNITSAQKSQSVSSSPLRNISQINATFSSSDNLANKANAENLNSGIFSFSKYFYSDPANIPPGSEILFGDNFMPMNEG